MPTNEQDWSEGARNALAALKAPKGETIRVDKADIDALVRETAAAIQQGESLGEGIPRAVMKAAGELIKKGG